MHLPFQNALDFFPLPSTSRTRVILLLPPLQGEGLVKKSYCYSNMKRSSMLNIQHITPAQVWWVASFYGEDSNEDVVDGF